MASAALLAVLCAGCSAAGDSDVSTMAPAMPTQPEPSGSAVPAPGGWEVVGDGELSPRAAAVGAWTGREVIVFGGEPVAWCPPQADCTRPDFEPLRDGAAFEPVTTSWRQIEGAPFTLSARNASVVVVDGAVYVLTREAAHRPGGAAAFVRYLVADDRWEVLPSLPGGHVSYALASGSGRVVVAYPTSDEEGERPDMVFDIEAGAWAALPPDPLSPAFDRSMVIVDDGVYLFARPIEANPGSQVPSTAHAARLDLSDGEWRRLADSPILETATPILAGKEIVFPWAGEADGGESGTWDRSYPFGGAYDLLDDAWSALPAPAANDDFAVAGVVGPSSAGYVATHGAVLDHTLDSWTAVPELEGEAGVTVNRTVVAAGSDLFVFGGETWVDGEGVVLDTAYRWIFPR